MDLKFVIEKCYFIENCVNLGDVNWLVVDEDVKIFEFVFKKILVDNLEGFWFISFIVFVEYYYGV